MAFFLQLRALLESELQQKFGSKRPKLSRIAGEVDLPASTLQMYLEGRRKPQPKRLEKLATFFYPASEEQRRGFRERVAAATAERSASDDVLAQLATGARTLRVSALMHPPLSGQDSFVGKFFHDRFLMLSGIGTSIDPTNRIDASEPDLVLGHLSTVDRTLRRKYVAETPARVSLGAICHQRHARSFEKIRNLLWLGKLAARELSVRPIVVRHEVGWLHCVHRLKYSDAELVTVDRLDEHALADELLRAEERGSNVIHVIVVDELTSVRVMGVLKGVGLPVIPLSTERSIRDCESRREMPVHSVGIPVARGARDFAEFVGDALPVFMQNDVERIASDYFWTHQQLEDILDANTKDIPLEYLDFTCDADNGKFGPMPSDQPLTAEEAALIEKASRDSLKRRWARTMLRLKLEDIQIYESPLPWRPVMMRTRQKLNQNLADQGFARIREFVDAAGKRHRWYRMHRIMSDIAETFDIELPHDAYQPTTQGAPVPALSYRIARALLGRPRPVKPVIAPADSSTREQVELILLDAYSLPATETEREKTRDRMRRVMTHFDEISASYLVATVEGEPAGLIQIEPYQGDAFGAAAEIAYLFVRPVWRSQGLGRWLVQHAADHATQSGYRCVIVDILKASYEATLLCRMLGFTSGPATEQGQYLQRELTPST